jgi:hypothetical protein
MFYIYVYLNPLKPGTFKYQNYTFEYEPFYIGKGCDHRMYDHLHQAEYLLEHNVQPFGNKLKFNILLKILKENLEPIIEKIWMNDDESHVFQKETYFIKLIGRRDLGLGPLSNMTDGGEGSRGYKHTNESIEKISDSLKKTWSSGNHNYDFKGEKNTFYGKTHSLENRKIFSETAKKNFTGIKQSEEQIIKKANAIKGDKNGMYGTNLLNKWIEKYGEIEGSEKLEQHVEETRRGKNNSQYGKKGKDHPTSKQIKIENEDKSFIKIFECREDFLLYLETNPIFGEKYSINTLRQYGKKNIYYKGYLYTTIKKNNDI